MQFVIWLEPRSWFNCYRKVAPKLMRVNLRKEGEKLQADLSGGEEKEPGVNSAFQSLGIRTYRVTNEKYYNRTVSELEAMPKSMRVFISRIRHEGTIIEPEPGMVIHQGDVIAVVTRTEGLVEKVAAIGPEVVDPALIDSPTEVLDVSHHQQGFFWKDSKGDCGFESLPTEYSCKSSFA